MKWHHKLLFATFAVVLLGLLIGVWKEKVEIDRKPPELLAGTLFPSPKPLPDFELKDDENQTFTQAEFQNAWHVLFFGYSHCPELCPKTLGVMAQAKRIINPRYPVQMMLISINPAQDTPARLHDFLQSPDLYKGQFKGLTGDRTQIKKLASQIGVFVQETIPEIGHIEHSGTLLVINPHGELVALITNPSDPQVVAQDIQKIARYRA